MNDCSRFCEKSRFVSLKLMKIKVIDNFPHLLGLVDRFWLNPHDVLFKKVILHHQNTCHCGNIDNCIALYRRCIINQRIYHSIKYLQRKRSVNHFIEFRQRPNQISFGMILLFYTQQQQQLALIQHYERKCNYSDYFRHSEYYNLIKKPIDLYFFVLTKSMNYGVIRVDTITNHLIILKNNRNTSTIVATPVH